MFATCQNASNNYFEHFSRKTTASDLTLVSVTLVCVHFTRNALVNSRICYKRSSVEHRIFSQFVFKTIGRTNDHVIRHRLILQMFLFKSNWFGTEQLDREYYM